MPVQFPYPETSWAQGRIRKRGDRNNNNNDDDETRFGARVQLASDVRRGRPQLEEPGLAEAERLAGASFRGRGGPAARSEVTKGAGGLSPDVIQEHKSQIQGFGQQW